MSLLIPLSEMFMKYIPKPYSYTDLTLSKTKDHLSLPKQLSTLTYQGNRNRQEAASQSFDFQRWM